MKYGLAAVLACLASFIAGLNACAPNSNGCREAMAEYGRAVATADPADDEAAWLGVPHFCEGRPDKP